MKWRAILALVILLGVATHAHAQATNTGSITGAVTDTSGAILPGVTVTASGPALMTPLVAVTSAQGQYRFPSLPPGTYVVRFELPGFSSYRREGVTVNIGFNAQINQQMAVAAVSEEVLVSGAAPVVDTKNTNIQTTITQQMLKDMPNARDIWSVIGQAPGFTVSNFDVGGSRAGTQTGYTAFGTSGQVRVQVDGVNTTEGTGGAGFYYDYGSFEEVQLGTDGNDASATTPGLQLNAIIKSGSNRFKGDLYYDYENKHLQATNITDALQRVGAGTGTRILAYRDPNFSAGGPIKKDKMWYFASIRDQRTGTTVSGFPVEKPSDFFFETRLTNYTEKLNYQLNPSNRLGQYIQTGRKYQPSRGASATNSLDSIFQQDSWSWAGNVELNSTIGNRMVLNTRVASFGYHWPNLPYGVTGELNANLRARMTDSAYGNTAGAAAHDLNERRRYQFDTTGTYFKDNFMGGDHSLKFGYTGEQESQDFTDYGFLGSYSLTFNSTNGRPEYSVPFRVTLRNTTRRSIDALWHHGAFISDQWKIGQRLSLNIGVRYDYYSAYYPDQNIPEGPWRSFMYAGAALPNGYSIPATAYASTMTIPGQNGVRKHGAFAPRIGAAFDVFGTGQTVAKVNWGRYYFNIGLASSATNPSQATTYTFGWNDKNSDKQFTSDELGSFVSNTGGTTNLIDPNIKQPYTDQFSAWVEHELIKGVGVRAGFTYRTDGNITQSVELARVSSLYTRRISVLDPGVDGTAGNGDDGAPFIVYDIPTASLVASKSITTTDSNSQHATRAMDFTITKRMSNRWSLMANYTYDWDHTVGLVQNPNQERFNDNTTTLWAFKMNGTYQGPWGVYVSPSLRYQAGAPLARVVTATSGTDLATAAAATINVSLNYQAERTGAYRSDNIMLLDARLEKRLTIGGKQLGLFFDAFNITNSNKSQSADNTVGRRTVTLPSGELVNYQRFLRPTSLLPARVYRFGFRFSF